MRHGASGTEFRRAQSLRELVCAQGVVPDEKGAYRAPIPSPGEKWSKSDEAYGGIASVAVIPTTPLMAAP